ncbi:MAG: phosphodiester glycosidase family protein [Chloroflexota bacterium]|nr:phosphodiester glycosidase family protein [Chloroflexota bacterium]
MNFEPLMNGIAAGAWSLIALAVFIGWRLRRRRWIVGLCVFVLLAALPIGVGAFWYNHRPLPAAEQRLLFPGVEYIRDVRPDVPIIIHVVRIDLATPSLRFLVTPHTPTDGHDQAARTTSGFLTEFGLQLAINGDGFAPWSAGDVFNFYPREGDPVNLRGRSASNGAVYTDGYTDDYDTAYFGFDNHVSFDTPPAQPYNAISGKEMLLIDGEKPIYRHSLGLHPRTAVGLDRAERTLLIIVVDGRQPTYSEGATPAQLAEIALEYGAWDALNLDGGGSTTLVIEGADGEPFVLNSPIHTRIPGRERPVANHLGLYIERNP